MIGTTNSLQGGITNNGAVQFSQLVAGTYAGSMSGTGTVEVSGVGPVTFTGTNSYSGGTTIDNGSTLIGRTQSLSGAFDNSGLLKFNQATSGTFSGIISGTGGVEVGGIAPVTFSGANLYAGMTTIDSGSTLNVVGSIVGDTNVNSGGVLGGSGSVGNVTVNSGGTIAPGTIGAPLTINGNLNQMTGSKFTVEVGPSTSDKIITTGTATIATGSTLHIVADPGSYVIGKKYDILSATGGLTGQYSPLSRHRVRMLFSANNTRRTILQLTVNSAFVNSAHSANQRAIATVLDQQSGAATGNFATAITQLTSLSGGQFSSALNQLSGELHASLGTVQQQTTTVQMQLLSNRLAFLSRTSNPAVTSTDSHRNIRLVSVQGGDANSPNALANGSAVEPPTWNSWVQGYGFGGNIGGDGNAGGTNYRLGGTLFGVERWLGEPP